MAKPIKIWDGTAWQEVAIQVPTNIIPSQTGNSGKYLTTNGTIVSWSTVDALPSQTSNSGKILTTNGTSASWATLTAEQIPSITSTKVSTVDINSQSSSYTLVLADASKLLLMTSASAQTVTIPTNASVAFPTGTKIDIVQTGAGQCDIAGASGVTLNSEGSKKKINAQYQVVSIVKTATDTWLLMGALKA